MLLLFKAVMLYAETNISVSILFSQVSLDITATGMVINYLKLQTIWHQRRLAC